MSEHGWGPRSLDEVDPEILRIYQKLGIPLEELSQVRSKQEAIHIELDELRTQNRAMEEKLMQGERDLNDQIDKNMQLLNQLGDVESDIYASRKQIRELEAELAALKANTGKSTPSGLNASRWAPVDESNETAVGGVPAAVEGGDLGPSIEGTVGPPRLSSTYPSEIPDCHPFT